MRLFHPFPLFFLMKYTPNPSHLTPYITPHTLLLAPYSLHLTYDFRLTSPCQWDICNPISLVLLHYNKIPYTFKKPNSIPKMKSVKYNWHYRKFYFDFSLKIYPLFLNMKSLRSYFCNLRT